MGTFNGLAKRNKTTDLFIFEASLEIFRKLLVYLIQTVDNASLRKFKAKGQR